MDHQIACVIILIGVKLSDGESFRIEMIDPHEFHAALISVSEAGFREAEPFVGPFHISGLVDADMPIRIDKTVAVDKLPEVGILTGVSW